MSNGRSYILKIDGEPLLGAMISKLESRQELGDHWWCEVEFQLADRERPPFEDYFGKSLEFVTVGEDGSQYSIFKGLVLEAELEYELHGGFLARIRAVTKSYLLQLTLEEDYFLKQTLQEVAQRVITQDGLELQFNAGGQMARMSYVQWEETDFDFIKRISDDQGCFVRPTPTGIEIRRGFQASSQTLQWHDEYGLVKFALRGRLGQPSFDGTCYDARTMQSQTFRKVKKSPQFFPSTAAALVAAVSTQSEQLPSGRVIFDGRAPKLDQYRALLEKESARSIGSKILGEGKSRAHFLKPGDAVKLSGYQFDAGGEYGLIRVVHFYDMTNGYRNEFTATPWKEYTAAEQPAPKRISGVVPARVVAHNDPRGMGRIQIQYDWMEGTATAWARMVTPHAGGGRGFMFMPEKGDEVLVTFEHGDPERPYIVGALWNGVDSAPRQGFWESEGVEDVAANTEGGNKVLQIPKDIARNDIKRIVTKSGHRIQFVDVQGKESIVVSTPGGQTIQLIDSCPETGGRKMLCLNSPGDIFLNAPDGRVHIRSKFFSKEVG
ncbi:MAG TPA: type VI secretion system tip protein VgrG [Blastocatellia bacterium]|nr:type VI secretion system tip protein VgrG [Blastocatellia bacterium]